MTQSKIELNEQILFSKDAGIFIGRIEAMTEKAVKVDYCFESLNGGGLTVYTYTTWIPKSVIINDEMGGLTVKKWFAANGLNKEKIYHVKKYYVSNGIKTYL
jgi:hypothetical protein